MFSCIGQSPGKYHGYVKDYVVGGTYNDASDPKDMIVPDLKRVAKSKMNSKFTRSNHDIHKAINNVVNRKNKFQEKNQLKSGNYFSMSLFGL